jgi:hypothetical protein
MTLSDILIRGVQLELHEAIATARAIVDAGATTGSPSIPELDQIELLPDGSVELLDSTNVTDPVWRLIEMLQILIGPMTRPPQLVSLMERPPEFLPAFSEALAYFERPNRSAILQDLYRRASGIEPTPDTDALIDELRTLPPATGGEQDPQNRARRRKIYLSLAALGLIVVVLAAVGLVRRAGGGSSLVGASSGLTSRVSEGVSGVTAAVGTAVASIGERVGLRGGTASQPPPSPPVVAVEPPKPPVTSVRRLRPQPESPTPDDIPLLNATAPPFYASPRPSPWAPVLIDAPTIVPDEPVVSGPDVNLGTVYTAGSPDVVAPVPVRPHVPKALPPGLGPGDVARIELVINADGNVASVKLLGQARTMNDAMMLSAAKAWRFRPAMRAGVPVQYRTAVLVAR